MGLVSAVRKVTPVLIVDKIEPVVAFWEKLGVKPSTQVPGADGLVFAIFSAEGVEVMYQTTASVKEDLVASSLDAQAFRGGPQQSVLYLEVGELAYVERLLVGERLVMPRRKTFYGAIESAYADPAGNIVVFAERDAGR